jgi:hypothetical protein
MKTAKMLSFLPLKERKRENDVSHGTYGSRTALHLLDQELKEHLNFQER